MTRRVLRRLQSIRDVVQTAEYISRESIQAADRFMDNVKESLQFLLEFPESGDLWHLEETRFPNLRTWQVKGFPNHLIYFRPIATGIEVIRICHASKNVSEFFKK